MICPVCKNEMVNEDFGGVKVDVCRNGCKGIWFDSGELKRLDENNEGLGNALKEAIDFPRVNDASRGQVNCPKCGSPMHRHTFESDKEVNIDECYACGGFFLDSGELAEVRNNHMSDEEEERYANKLLQNMPVYQKAERELEKEEDRAEAIRNFTKYLRLSYFVTGK